VTQKHVFTIDTGTTNTRVCLWSPDERLIGTEKRGIGVRNTAIDGDNSRLKGAIRECLENLLAKNGLTYADVSQVIAGGMITSNVGLVEIPHLTAPVSAEDLARGMRVESVPDVCPVPISFIPGVKNSAEAVTLDNFEAMDIMRGEEIETVALMEQAGLSGPCLIVLPGSHTKFVSVDEKGRITGCLTSITGELVSAITNNTIIADAVGRGFVQPETYDREMLLLGCDTAQKSGLGRACFSARILSQFAKESPERLANYILGACLQSDVAAVQASDALKIPAGSAALVAGKPPLAQAVTDVLIHAGCFADVRLSETGSDMPLSAAGALSIARRREK